MVPPSLFARLEVRTHDDLLWKVYPAALAYSYGRQQAQPLAGAGVDLEDRHPPPGLNALQVEPGVIWLSAKRKVNQSSW